MLGRTVRAARYGRPSLPAAAANTLFAAAVTIRRRRFANPDSGFAVLDAETDDERLVLVGPLAHLEEGERAQVQGEWVEDAKFGRQVRVARADPVAPDD